MLQGLDVSIGYVINTHSLNQNCYYCSVAFLKGIDTDELVSRTEIMQEQTANLDVIEKLMGEAGIAYDFSGMQHVNDIEQYTELIPLNARFGLAFQRLDGTGHMIVGEQNARGIFTLYDPQVAKEAQHDEIPSYIRLNNMYTFGLFLVTPQSC
ncbi:hypothetical protein AAIA71_03355 [Vibrio harveyi]|uniref:hypothetical protein n=1 Tax=Vibrio harveyi TaxID=669 RepID=UPI00237F60C4|nr:hypothetical protein [Vibrio harveyi]HDM8072181.1 hypothetical protein [Vibrio harveyi]